VVVQRSSRPFGGEHRVEINLNAEVKSARYNPISTLLFFFLGGGGGGPPPPPLFQVWGV